MAEKYSVAHLRTPDDAHLPSPFNCCEDLFRECFKFSRDNGYKLMNLLAEAANFDPERHKTYDKYSFDIILFSTISYMVHGDLVYLWKHHEVYKKFPKKELVDQVPKVSLTIILLWAESHVCFPLVRPAIKKRLKGFKEKNCPNIIGIMNTSDFIMKKVQKSLFKTKTVSMSVQFICDELGRFTDVFSSFSPLVETKAQTWQLSHVRKAMKSIREDFSDLFLVADHDYPTDDDLLLTPGCPRLKGMAHDPDIMHVIDKAIYDLKNRFMCLNGGLPFYHQDTFYIINACVILHNFIIVQEMFVPISSYFASTGKRK